MSTNNICFLWRNKKKYYADTPYVYILNLHEVFLLLWFCLQQLSYCPGCYTHIYTAGNQEPNMVACMGGQSPEIISMLYRHAHVNP